MEDGSDELELKEGAGLGNCAMYGIGSWELKYPGSASRGLELGADPGGTGCGVKIIGGAPGEADPGGGPCGGVIGLNPGRGGPCIGSGLLFVGGAWLPPAMGEKLCLPKAKGSVTGCVGGAAGVIAAAAPCL